jgi:hypothetical protein
MKSRHTALSLIGLGLILLALVVRSNLLPDYDAIAQDERLRSLEIQLRVEKQMQEDEKRWSTISEKASKYNEGLMRDMKLKHDLQSIREGNYRP